MRRRAWSELLLGNADPGQALEDAAAKANAVLGAKQAVRGRTSRFALVPAMRLSSRAKKALVAFGFLLPSLVPLVVFTIYPLINSG